MGSMGTPRMEQGQGVERSYGWVGEGGDCHYYRRVREADGSVRWYRADAASERALPDDYDAGGALYPPRVTEWIPCAEPVEE